MIFYSDITVHSKLTIGVNDTGHDVQFFGATAGKSLLWDESADRLIFADTTYLALGSDSDMVMYHTDTHGYIVNQKGRLIIQNSDDDEDIIFKCDDGGGGNATYLTLDGGTKTIEVSVPINVGVNDAGHDVKFFGATAGSFMLWDESADTLSLTDSTPLEIGDGGDFSIFHDGSDTFFINETGNLYVDQRQDNGTIRFGSDDGGGGTTTYMTIDGSAEEVTFFVPIKILDSGSVTSGNGIEIGTGVDMELYHDASNSYITNKTGALKIATETSGIAVTIGHTTSEVQFGDNLTIAGNVTAKGEIILRNIATPGNPVASHAVIWMDNGAGETPMGVYVKFTDAAGETTTQCTLCSGGE